jgi:hypothetical protein
MSRRHVGRDRYCDHCDAWYFRGNRMALWTKRNPGHREGWQKEVVKLCNECFSLNGAHRALMLTSIRIAKHGLLSLTRRGR